MDFEVAYPMYRHEIDALSQRSFLDLDPDDIAAEMTVALWKATQTYDPAKTDTPFGAYWWSVWKNRRSDLAEAYYARKRLHPDLVEPHSDLLDHMYDPWTWPKPPPGSTPLGQILWTLLAVGNNAREVMALTEITKRAYYAQIASWRTEEVRDWLRAE